MIPSEIWAKCFLAAVADAFHFQVFVSCGIKVKIRNIYVFATLSVFACVKNVDVFLS